MRELDLASPSWGEDPDEDGGGLDVAGLNPSAAELADVLDVVAEVDAEALTDHLSTMSDDELAALERDGADFNAWLDGLDDQQFADVSAEARLHDGQFLDYMHAARQLERTHGAMQDRDATRQREDAEMSNRRSGPLRNRPGTEVRLASAMERLQRGTYVKGQVDLSGDGWDPLGQFSAPAASPQEITAELRYQLTGEGLPPARSRLQPGLPHFSRRRMIQLGLLPL